MLVGMKPKPSTTASQPRERPILFSGPMVRAILAGKKTQTRRVVKPQPNRDAGYASNPFKWSRVKQVGPWFHIISDDPSGMFTVHCSYGTPGDTLWVRETWNVPPGSNVDAEVAYFADGHHDETATWRPSIHMPRWASRLSLSVTDVRVERLHELTRNDAIAEGIPQMHGEAVRLGLVDAAYSVDDWDNSTSVENFANLWDKLNSERAPWKSNPWVWVVAFERIKS